MTVNNRIRGNIAMGESVSGGPGLDRRTFLKESGLVSLGVGLSALPVGRVGANDTINIALIGCNGMGFANTRSTLNVPGTRCIALCDVDRNVLERRSGELVELYGEQPRIYSDYRALLDDPDVDAVIIATPDHWHCLQMVHACETGKDVYVEKPLANSIVECERMVAAQEAGGSVVQVGQWQRSGLHWIEAMDFVQSGQLGRIRTVKAWMYNGGMRPLPVRPDEPAPDGVDYDMWLGPAPLRPYNRNRFHGSFRWFWDYAGGLMTDWGVHLIDPVLWGMQVEHPKRVMSTGGNFGFPESAMETPDTQQAIYEFDDFTMVWEHTMGAGLGPFQRTHGVAFVGRNGTLVVDRNQWEIFPETERGASGPPSYRMAGQPVRTSRPEDRGLDHHTADFVDCMWTREKPACDVRTGSMAAVNAHLGNIALRTRETLEWDAGNLRFADDPVADELLQTEYRRPWRIPG